MIKSITQSERVSEESSLFTHYITVAEEQGNQRKRRPLKRTFIQWKSIHYTAGNIVDYSP